MESTLLLLTGFEVDELLRLPPGKADRLARRQLLPHLTLPDGSIRYRVTDMEALIGCPVGHAEPVPEAVSA